MSKTGFKFAWLVELLQALDNVRISKALPTSRTSNPDYHVVKQWFSKYDSRIPRQGEAAYAFLACMFPERLPQRSYAIKELRLSAIFGRALGLGATRARRLTAWQVGDCDFASCVEAVMAECEFDAPSPKRDVTLEEIDSTLNQIAANSAFSSSEMRQWADGRNHDQLLAPILRRLSSREAKWLVRMILKSYSPIQVPERTAMLQFHFLLPSILSVQDSIAAAINHLNQPNIASLPHNPEPDAADAFKKTVLKGIVPRLAIMVKRQPYEKARSINHCCQMADKRLMSIERKYDGEYCQIHIDRSQSPQSCIQIFSKSGKDSTDDRIRLHGAICESLLLGRPGCKIKRKCILEGELLVCNRITCEIQPFHKIRRHVMHGRRFLGVDADSPPSVDEHLMIMFYDLLMLDDKTLANEPHHKRRQYLKVLINQIPGMAEVGERELINFGSRRAPEELRAMFAKSITNGWEGFVLKGYEESYFSQPAGPRSIKLKKDYITGLGDSADLCIIGGRADPKLVAAFNLHTVSWTTFYLACLENKREVVRFDGKPRFKVIDTINPQGIPRNDILELNKQGQFMEIPFSFEQDVFTVEMAVSGSAPPVTLFRRPIVVEVMGAGFDKNSNCDFYTLRFPRLTRIHLDRDLKDTTTFAGLQDMAKNNETKEPSIDSQEDAKWIERLAKADSKNRYIIDKSQSTSPGKTPRSPASISVGHVLTKRSKPPVFVRTDTSELLQHDIEARHDSQTTTSSCVSVPVSAVAKRSKRKPSQAMSAPEANKVGKRRRLASTRDAFESAPIPQISQGSATPNVGMSRARVDRMRGSPQPAAAEQPASPGRPRVWPSTRGPLAEMTNVSPELDRRSQPCSRLQANALDPFNADSQGKKVTRSRLAMIMERGQDAARLGSPFLLTPPTSCAESAAVKRPKYNDRAQNHQEQHQDVIPNRMRLPTRVDQTPMGIGLTSPVYLSTSLATKESSYWGSLPLHQLLQQSTFAFTHSSSCFISYLFGENGQRPIVLVDGSDPKAVAGEILELGLELVNCPQVDSLRERAVVVFADASFLRSTSCCHGKAISTKDLDNAFCAELELGPDIIDEKGHRAARVARDLGGLNQV